MNAAVTQSVPPGAAGRTMPANPLGAPELLDLWRRACASTPFQHPAYLWLWWSQFGAPAGATLHPWTLRDPDGALAAFAPWTLYSRRFWFAPTIRRLQLLGQGAWIGDGFPSEYADLLSTAASAEQRHATYLQALDASLDLEWDDLQVAYVVHASPFDRALRAWAARRGFLYLTVGAEFSYAVDTAGAEPEYRRRLSVNARRALYGRWPRAAARGLRFVADAGSGAAPLETLFRLHEARWGTQGMQPGTREFLRRLAEARAPGATPRVSLLVAGDEPVSASLNVDSDGVIYNLQGGFLPDWDRGVSPGKLHFGRELERAFADPAIHTFDLLVGRGMKADYKASIATRRIVVSTVWIVRTRLLRAALVGRRALRALFGRPTRPEWPGSASR